MRTPVREADVLGVMSLSQSLTPQQIWDRVKAERGERPNLPIDSEIYTLLHEMTQREHIISTRDERSSELRYRLTVVGQAIRGSQQTQAVLKGKR